MANQDIVFGRQVIAPLTNAGTSVTSGDVVIVDTANDLSFTTSTSSNFAGTIGVAQEAIAAGSNGRILIGGYAPAVNVGANTVSRGQYLYHSGTAKTAIGAGFAATGAFGYVSKGGTGTTPVALIFPPIQGVGQGTSAGSNSMDVSGASSAGASTTQFSPFDHRHKGVVAVTSSASNTLETPTVNIRAGANIGITATDTNGNGVFDTIHIHGPAPSAGGGGGSVTVTEPDGTSVASVDTIRFPNGTVTDLGGGDVDIRQVPTGFIGAKAWREATLALSASTFTVLGLDNEEFDTDGFHDNSTNNSRFTIPAGLGGKYLLTGAVPGGGSSLMVLWRKNGSDLRGQSYIEATAAAVTSTQIVDLVAGDYVELTAWSAGTPTLGHATDDRQQIVASITKLDSGKVGTGVGARVYNSASLAGTAGTFAALTFNTERYDTDGFHSTSSNTDRLTIPAGMGGKYLIGGGFTVDAAANNGNNQARIRLNGATTIAQWQDAEGGANHKRASFPPTIYDLAAGDYVTLDVAPAQTNAAAILAEANASPEFWIMRLDSLPAGTPLIAILQDQKSSGTAGGTATTDAWTTRTLNTEVSDPYGIVSIASNLFTPIAGTYRLRATMSMHAVNRCQSRLYNNTTTTAVQVGMSGFASSAGNADCPLVLDAVFTANGTDAYAIQYYADDTTNSFDLGVSGGWGTEVYLSVVLEKLS